jgi:L-lactate dehydrogenase complex protein LldG
MVEGTMSSARNAMLARIRDAVDPSRGLPAEEYGDLERRYRQHGTSSRAELIALFTSRIVHYDGHVFVSSPAELSATIGRAVLGRGKRVLHHPRDLDPRWLPTGIEFVSEAAPTLEALDASDGVVTGCTVAIASTGTIVLAHGSGEGRRALTLVPDYHLAIVFAAQIVETVPEGLARVAARRSSVMTTISGPSATADIEMTRIKGVHGPRTLDVIVVD